MREAAGEKGIWAGVCMGILQWLSTWSFHLLLHLHVVNYGRNHRKPSRPHWFFTSPKIFSVMHAKQIFLYLKMLHVIHFLYSTLTWFLSSNQLMQEFQVQWWELIWKHQPGVIPYSIVCSFGIHSSKCLSPSSAACRYKNWQQFSKSIRSISKPRQWWWNSYSKTTRIYRFSLFWIDNGNHIIQWMWYAWWTKNTMMSLLTNISFF